MLPDASRVLPLASCTPVHEPLDPEFTILKQRLARRLRYEGASEADVQVRRSERHLTCTCRLDRQGRRAGATLTKARSNDPLAYQIDRAAEWALLPVLSGGRRFMHLVCPSLSQRQWALLPVPSGDRALGL
jgi:hypothetical protein